MHAAHILGAAMAEITLASNGARRALLFTGDIGRVRNSTIAPGKVVHSGPTEGESPDVLVMESTYGNRHHPQEDVMPDLAELINATVERGGSIVVPAFAVERTQKFLFLLKELMEQNRIPRIPVYADSPMGIHAVQIFLKHSEEFSAETTRPDRPLRLARAVAGIPLCQHAAGVETDQREPLSHPSSSRRTECAWADAFSIT